MPRKKFVVVRFASPKCAQNAFTALRSNCRNPLAKSEDLSRVEGDMLVIQEDSCSACSKDFIKKFLQSCEGAIPG